MLSAAPVPRPPQPIRPTLIVSLPLAWALGREARPAAVAVDTLRKSRRLGELVNSVMGYFSGGQESGPSEVHDALGRGPRKANETTAIKLRWLISPELT